MGTAESRDATPPLIPCVGALVHDADGRLLVIRRGHAPHAGLWSVPGGRVEPGESPAAAAEREVLEETGLRVRVGAVVGTVLIPAGEVVYEVTDFLCTPAHPDEQPVAGGDASAVQFVDGPALDRLACTPDLVRTLRGWGVLPR